MNTKKAIKEIKQGPSYEEASKEKYKEFINSPDEKPNFSWEGIFIGLLIAIVIIGIYGFVTSTIEKHDNKLIKNITQTIAEYQTKNPSILVSNGTSNMYLPLLPCFYLENNEMQQVLVLDITKKCDQLKLFNIQDVQEFYEQKSFSELNIYRGEDLK